MDNPACTVCIANYNGMDVIAKCLESVMNQEPDFPIEIIVHDDASTDGSALFIQEHFPGVTLLRSKDNVGFCVSNNRMAHAARGDYLLLLNNDAVLHKDALKTLHAYAQEQHAPVILSLPQYDAHTGKLIDMGEFLDPFMNPVPNCDPGKKEVGMVIGACLWISKNLWVELGGFPEWFGNLAEDMYLCCLARLRGYKVVALPQSGYDHWVGKSLGGGKLSNNELRTTFRRRSLSERNKSYVMFLYYPAPILLFMFPIHLLLLFLEGIALSLIKRQSKIMKEIYFRCFQLLWNDRKRLVAARSDIQKTRLISLKNLLAGHSLLPYKLSMMVKYGLPTIE